VTSHLVLAYVLICVHSNIYLLYVWCVCLICVGIFQSHREFYLAINFGISAYMFLIPALYGRYVET